MLFHLQVPLKFSKIIHFYILKLFPPNKLFQLFALLALSHAYWLVVDRHWTFEHCFSCIFFLLLHTFIFNLLLHAFMFILLLHTFMFIFLFHAFMLITDRAALKASARCHLIHFRHTASKTNTATMPSNTHSSNVCCSWYTECCSSTFIMAIWGSPVDCTFDWGFPIMSLVFTANYHKIC